MTTRSPVTDVTMLYPVPLVAICVLLGVGDADKANNTLVAAPGATELAGAAAWRPTQYADVLNHLFRNDLPLAKRAVRIGKRVLRAEDQMAFC